VAHAEARNCKREGSDGHVVSLFSVSSVLIAVRGRAGLERKLIKVDDELKKAICDRLEGWELVDFLQVPIEEILDLLEERVEENIEDVLDFCNLRNDNNNNND
tara:strand:+ start:281 stop:589 length:309 start_codon:yes stop_codon:yes gene_type:complete